VTAFELLPQSVAVAKKLAVPVELLPRLTVSGSAPTLVGLLRKSSAVTVIELEHWPAVAANGKVVKAN
jgi:hypothetical protein